MQIQTRKEIWGKEIIPNISFELKFKRIIKTKTIHSPIQPKALSITSIFCTWGDHIAVAGRRVHLRREDSTPIIITIPTRLLFLVIFFLFSDWNGRKIQPRRLRIWAGWTEANEKWSVVFEISRADDDRRFLDPIIPASVLAVVAGHVHRQIMFSLLHLFGCLATPFVLVGASIVVPGAHQLQSWLFNSQFLENF